MGDSEADAKRYGPLDEEETVESLQTKLEREQSLRYDLQERLAEAEAKVSALHYDLQNAREEIRDLKSELSDVSYQLESTRDIIDRASERW